MWIRADYEPVGLFSLKSSLATSTGAKTLLIPTPFAIRSALLDAAIRTRGRDVAESAFGWIKDLGIYAQPPEHIVVTNLFAKVQKPERSEGRRGEGDEDSEVGMSTATIGRKTIGFRGASGTFRVPAEQGRGISMQKSIAFREYAFLEGVLSLAFSNYSDELELADLTVHVNYFGKRGGFFQRVGYQVESGEPAPSYIRLDGPPQGAVPAGISLLLDDWGAELTFDRLNVYADTTLRSGIDRVQRLIVIPYRLVRSSRAFTHYTLSYGADRLYGKYAGIDLLAHLEAEHRQELDDDPSLRP